MKIYHRFPGNAAGPDNFVHRKLRACALLLGGAVFFCGLSVAFAAEDGSSVAASIGGQVVDEESGDPLVGVVLQITGTPFGGTTDLDGRFHVDGLPAGVCRVRLSFMGYTEKTLPERMLQAGEHSDMGRTALALKVIRLSEVVVTPGSYSIMNDGPVRAQTLGSDDLENMSFAEDITRAVTRLPGVASNDFSSKFTIRGGESDEVLMNLDGMELYEPFHQRDFVGGLFSIVDIETIEGIELLTGGFSAEYGDRQSGVFNMKTKSSSDGHRRSSVGLSVMNARLYTEGSFAEGEGSYLLSARRGVLDKIRVMSVVDDETTHFFHDLMGKVEYPLSPKHLLSMHVLISGDKAEVRDVEPGVAHDIHDTSYDNTYGWLSLKSFHTSDLYSRTLLYGGDITHGRHGDSDKDEYTDKMVFLLSDDRSYRFYGLKQDWVWDLSRRVSLKTGFDLKQLNAEYDYSYSLSDVRADAAGVIGPFYNAVDVDEKPSGQQTSVYLSTRFNPLEDLYVETGLRNDRATWADDNLWSPRVSMAYSLTEHTIARAAWGYYYQSHFINNLDVNHSATEFDPAELSKHYVLGLEHTFANGVHTRLDGYTKEISHISDAYLNLRDPWEVFPEARNDEVFIRYGDANASGVELFLKYDQGRKISWWFSYALARAEETVRSIDFNGLLVRRTGTLPRQNNQRHTIYCDVNYRPTNKWHVNLSWQYYTGWPLTTYTYVTEHEYSDPPPPDLFMAAAHNGFRAKDYPAYHRMDVRVNRDFQIRGGKLKVYLHLINLYNRENLRKFDVDSRNSDEMLVADGQGGYQYFRDDTTWFGRLPVLGLSWEF
jgi:outer membrane receptor for ferrienterochelin and colicin